VNYEHGQAIALHRRNQRVAAVFPEDRNCVCLLPGTPPLQAQWPQVVCFASGREPD
jgi:hypothetical protein